MPKRNIKGFIDPISIIGVLFLIITLVVGTKVTNDRKISLNINEQAKKEEKTGNAAFDKCREESGREVCNERLGTNINWKGEDKTVYEEPAAPAPEAPAAIVPTSNTLEKEEKAYECDPNDGGSCLKAVAEGKAVIKYYEDPKEKAVEAEKQTAEQLATEQQTIEKSQCLQDGGSWLNNTCSYAQQKEAIAKLTPIIEKQECEAQGRVLVNGECISAQTFIDVERDETGTTRDLVTIYRDEQNNVVGSNVVPNITIQNTQTVEKDAAPNGRSSTTYNTIIRDGDNNIITYNSIPTYTESFKNAEKVDDGFIRDFTTILRNQNTNEILNAITQSVNTKDLAQVAQPTTNTHNFADCNREGLTPDQTSECNRKLSQVYNAPIIGRYLQAYSPEKVKTYWEIHYNSREECLNDFVGRGKGYCDQVQYTKEQLASSVSLGVAGTAVGALVVASGGAATGAITGYQAIALAMATSTMYQTGSAVDICVTAPNSPECDNAKLWAAVSWVNVGSSGLANAYQASKLAQGINTAVNVANIGADALDISQSCGDGQFASNFGCVAAWGGLVVDVGQGGVDIARVINNNISGLSGNLGSLPDVNSNIVPDTNRFFATNPSELGLTEEVALLAKTNLPDAPRPDIPMVEISAAKPVKPVNPLANVDIPKALDTPSAPKKTFTELFDEKITNPIRNLLQNNNDQLANNLDKVVKEKSGSYSIENSPNYINKDTAQKIANENIHLTADGNRLAGQSASKTIIDTPDGKYLIVEIQAKSDISLVEYNTKFEEYTTSLKNGDQMLASQGYSIAPITNVEVNGKIYGVQKYIEGDPLRRANNEELLNKIANKLSDDGLAMVDLYNGNLIRGTDGKITFIDNDQVVSYVSPEEFKAKIKIENENNPDDFFAEYKNRDVETRAVDLAVTKIKKPVFTTLFGEPKTIKISKNTREITLKPGDIVDTPLWPKMKIPDPSKYDYPIYWQDLGTGGSGPITKLTSEGVTINPSKGNGDVYLNFSNLPEGSEPITDIKLIQEIYPEGGRKIENGAASGQMIISPRFGTPIITHANPEKSLIQNLFSGELFSPKLPATEIPKSSQISDWIVEKITGPIANMFGGTGNSFQLNDNVTITIDRIITSGKQGDVSIGYMKVDDQVNKIKVAVKELRKPTGDDIEFVKSLNESEINILNTTTSSVKPKFYGSTDNKIVLEYVEGVNLNEYLKTATTEQEVIVYQRLEEALQTLHNETGLPHGDLNTVGNFQQQYVNAILTPDGNIMFIDQVGMVRYESYIDQMDLTKIDDLTGQIGQFQSQELSIIGNQIYSTRLKAVGGILLDQQGLINSALDEFFPQGTARLNANKGDIFIEIFDNNLEESLLIVVNRLDNKVVIYPHQDLDISEILNDPANTSALTNIKEQFGNLEMTSPETGILSYLDGVQLDTTPIDLNIPKVADLQQTQSATWFQRNIYSLTDGALPTVTNWVKTEMAKTNPNAFLNGPVGDFVFGKPNLNNLDTPRTINLPETRSDEIQNLIDTSFRELSSDLFRQSNAGQHITGYMTEGEPTNYLFGHTSAMEIVGAKVETTSGTLSVLDVGAAKGGFISNVKNTYPEIDAHALSAHDYRTPGNLLKGIDYRLGNAENISDIFPESSFDIVVTNFTVTHFKDPLGAITEMYNTLKPGGLLMIDEFRVPGIENSAEDIYLFLKNNGYEVFMDFNKSTNPTVSQLETDSINFLVIRKGPEKLNLPVEYAGITQDGDEAMYKLTGNLQKNQTDLPQEVKDLFTLERSRFSGDPLGHFDDFIKNNNYTDYKYKYLENDRKEIQLEQVKNAIDSGASAEEITQLKYVHSKINDAINAYYRARSKELNQFADSIEVTSGNPTFIERYIRGKNGTWLPNLTKSSSPIQPQLLAKVQDLYTNYIKDEKGFFPQLRTPTKPVSEVGTGIVPAASVSQDEILLFKQRIDGYVNEITPDDILTAHNQEAVSNYINNRLFNPAVDVSNEPTVEITKTSSSPKLESVLSGTTDINDLPETILNPGVLGLKLKELRLHSATFDQEASNIIIRQNGTLSTLDKYQAYGVYQPLQRGYSTGVQLTIPGTKPLTDIHSHPLGSLDLARIKLDGQTVNPKVERLLGNLPSSTDIIFLLRKGKLGADFSSQSIIVVGPDISILITRTPQTPPFFEYVPHDYSLEEEFKTLTPQTGNIINDQSSKTIAIVKKYNLAMYTMTPNENNPLSVWERFYPQPIENISIPTQTPPLTGVAKFQNDITNWVKTEMAKTNPDAIKNIGQDITTTFDNFKNGFDEKIIKPIKDVWTNPSQTPTNSKVEDVISKLNKLMDRIYPESPNLPECRTGLCGWVSDDVEVAFKYNEFKTTQYQVADLNATRGMVSPSFKHAITVIEDNKGGKYLIDLTFSQFINKETIKNPIAAEIFEKGYIKLDDNTLNEYLNLMTSSNVSQPKANLDILEQTKARREVQKYTPEEIEKYYPELVNYETASPPLTGVAKFQEQVGSFWDEKVINGSFPTGVGISPLKYVAGGIISAAFLDNYFDWGIVDYIQNNFVSAINHIYSDNEQKTEGVKLDSNKLNILKPEKIIVVKQKPEELVQKTRLSECVNKEILDTAVVGGNSGLRYDSKFKPDIIVINDIIKGATYDRWTPAELAPEAVDPVKEWVQWINEQGYSPFISSGYRSYETQQAYSRSYGNEAATPGGSCHQSGLCFDVHFYIDNKTGKRYDLCYDPNLPECSINMNAQKKAQELGIAHPYEWDQPHYMVAIAASPAILPFVQQQPINKTYIDTLNEELIKLQNSCDYVNENQFVSNP